MQPLKTSKATLTNKINILSIYRSRDQHRLAKVILYLKTKTRKQGLLTTKLFQTFFPNEKSGLSCSVHVSQLKARIKKLLEIWPVCFPKRGIPAVVAMQYSVIDDVATKFAYNFYRAIASGNLLTLL